jgi:hypothetical protein
MPMPKSYRPYIITGGPKSNYMVGIMSNFLCTPIQSGHLQWLRTGLPPAKCSSCLNFILGDLVVVCIPRRLTKKSAHQIAILDFKVLTQFTESHLCSQGLLSIQGMLLSWPSRSWHWFLACITSYEQVKDFCQFSKISSLGQWYKREVIVKISNHNFASTGQPTKRDMTSIIHLNKKSKSKKKKKRCIQQQLWHAYEILSKP